MRRFLVALCACLLLSQLCFAEPSLLLPAQRLKRLKRDRERQTQRWINFENRVKNVSDSPERGFELALYYAITGDDQSGREAIAWIASHPCDARQSALVRDWVGPPSATPSQSPRCAGSQPGPLTVLRNQAFTALASGQSCDLDWGRRAVQLLHDGAYRNTTELYAGAELLFAIRQATRTDPREQFSAFFSALPTLFLLGLKPQELERVDWITHVAALALVGLDPNSNGAQFLQGWAIEDRHMLRDGPGVAYELLWADPYLPGVGYQNLDPWSFDSDTGSLVARTDWTPESCWVEITTQGTENEQCPEGWQTRPLNFGRLRLVPMTNKCVDVPNQPSQGAVILWKLAPGQKVRYDDPGARGQTGTALPTGLWRVPGNVTGRVCIAR